MGNKSKSIRDRLDNKAIIDGIILLARREGWLTLETPSAGDIEDSVKILTDDILITRNDKDSITLSLI